MKNSEFRLPNHNIECVVPMATHSLFKQHFGLNNGDSFQLTAFHGNDQLLVRSLKLRASIQYLGNFLFLFNNHCHWDIQQEHEQEHFGERFQI